MKELFEDMKSKGLVEVSARCLHRGTRELLEIISLNTTTRELDNVLIENLDCTIAPEFEICATNKGELEDKITDRRN